MKTKAWTLILGLTFTSAAYADLVSSTGSVDPISPPASVVVNVGLESNTNTFEFTEVKDFILPSAVTVDIDTPGTYNATTGLPQGAVGAGTAVDSYYLHSDPVGTSDTLGYSGSVTFNTNILGIIVLDPEFNASNGVVGHIGTLYSSSGMGLELGGGDTLTLTVTDRTVTFSETTSTAADDIRIITAASVPEPSTLVLFGTVLAGAAILSKRRGAKA